MTLPGFEPTILGVIYCVILIRINLLTYCKCNVVLPNQMHILDLLDIKLL